MTSTCSRCGSPLESGAAGVCSDCKATVVGTQSLPATKGESLEAFGPELSVGDLLEEKWKVESKLGEGGMGMVVSALDLQLNRKVAVKVLARHLCKDPVALSRFEREAQLTAQLDHPNIVPVYATGRFHGRPFIVMKRLEGRSLGEEIKARKGPWPWAEVRAVLAPLCAGLTYLHQRGLVHRDVKPSNVFLGPGGEVTLLDFGILKQETQDLTQTGTLVGTVRFMAPEQITHSSVVDSRADIYSLGTILYRLLAGQLPFSGDDIDVARRKLAENPPSARAFNPQLPAPVAAVLERSIAREAGARPVGVAELLAELDQAFVQPATVAVAKTPSRRDWAIGAGVLVAGAAAVALFFSRAEPPVVTPPPAVVEVAAPKVEPEPVPAPVPTPTPEPPPAAPVEKKTVTTRAAPVRRTVAAKEAASAALVKVSVLTKIDGRSGYAQLFVDGHPQGETPVQLELKPGPHHLKVTRDGYSARETRFDVQPGQPQHVVLELAH
ncbi:MAG: serine/threonine-protein kinase [Myxococcaceae bacterium]